MQTAILKSNSNSDLKLLIQLAKKIGINAKILNKTEIEDISIVNAIRVGKTGEYIDTNSYIKKLRKWSLKLIKVL